VHRGKFGVWGAADVEQWAISLLNFSTIEIHRLNFNTSFYFIKI